jgi:hypothetical protein
MDGGAHIDKYTVFAGEFLRKGRLYNKYCTQSTSYNCLKTLDLINKMNNVLPLKVAVWNKRGK